MNRTLKKWIIISTIIIVIGGGSWFLLNGKDQTQNVSAQVQTTSVQKGKLEVEATGSGSVTAITDQDVAANTILVVDSVSVSSGDTVDKGDTLITFENGDVVTLNYF